MKSVVESFAVDKPGVTRSGGARREKGGTKGAWKERLKSSTLKGGVVLDAEETTEGLIEVVELARQAGEKGSVDAWMLLGDLHLVRSALSSLLFEPN